jgi:hypothetical protein
MFFALFAYLSVLSVSSNELELGATLAIITVPAATETATVSVTASRVRDGR